MLRPRTSRLAAAGIVLFVAACGSSGTASTAPGADATPTPKAAVTAGTPSDAAATPVASTAAGDSGGGGGVTAGTACDLLTPADASGVVGGDALTSASITGDPSYCSYKTAAGAIAVATSLGQKDAKVGYDAWAGASDSVKVSGLGDGAVWVPSLSTLLIIKGDRVFGITAGTNATEEDQRQEWAKALGAIAAGKM